MSRRAKIVTACLVVPTILFGLIICFPTIEWVGHTHLKVEFLVIDHETGEPIPGADFAFGSFQRDERGGTAFLKTDEEGKTSFTFRDIMCSGKENLLFRIDTFGCEVPFWSFQVAANGYERTELMPLHQYDKKEAIKRTGPAKSKIVVFVPLNKTGH